MAVENVVSNSAVGIDGNTYTSSIGGNDQLTNEDFLQLMITELQMQDPTAPMDSQRMLDTQMQMSAINTNLETIEAMRTLVETFTQSALSNAANVIGKNIEDGNTGDDGVNKAYTVRSVENIDGEVNVKAQQILYVEDQILDSDGNRITYNINGEILDSDGTATGMKVALANPGEVIMQEGKPVILDADNEQVEDSGYTMEGEVLPVYSSELTSIPFSSVTRIF